MFFIGFGNTRTLQILTFTISFLINLISEINFSRSYNSIQRFKREVVRYNLSSNLSNKFVYAVVDDYHAKNAYHDSYFNITINYPVVGRIVEYCQWKQNNPEYFTQLSLYEMYKRVWTMTQINSNYFFDQNYRNPKTLHLNKTVKYMLGFKLRNGIEIGGLMNVDDGFYIYNVEDKDVYDFENSEAGNKFEYIGNDIFYYSIDGTLQKKYMNDLNTNRNETIKKIMQQCRAGDIRVSFAVFKPPVFTVIGFLNNESKIVPGVFQNIQFGNILQGNISLNLLLEAILKEQNDKSEFNDINRSTSFILIMSILFSVLSFHLTIVSKSLTLILVGIINLLIRSLIWDKPILSLKIWLPVFIIYLPFYYLFVYRRII